MLKGISPIISPELLKLIAEMGHGDELVLADANFPGASIGKRCIRCDGHGCADVMRALLTLFPLDDFVTAPLAVMEVPQGMSPRTRLRFGRRSARRRIPTCRPRQFDMMDHDAFMERARAAYAVVQTAKRRFTETSSSARALSVHKPCGILSLFSVRQAASARRRGCYPPRFQTDLRPSTFR